MKTLKKQLLAATVATVLSAGFIASSTTPAFAASDPEVVAQDNEQVADQDLVRVSEDALISMRDLHKARLAIFNGQPLEARTFVDAAMSRVDAAAGEAEKYALDIKAPKQDDQYIPFDASLTVLDTFEPADGNSGSKASANERTKARHIASANKHLKNGQQKEALETLKLGDVDVAVSAGLVPVKFAREHINMAADLIGQGKYYEANLALKAVDDATIVETYAIDAIPKPRG
jgi:hypothetical protein